MGINDVLGGVFQPRLSYCQDNCCISLSWDGTGSPRRESQTTQPPGLRTLLVKGALSVNEACIKKIHISLWYRDKYSSRYKVASANRTHSCWFGGSCDCLDHIISRVCVLLVVKAGVVSDRPDWGPTQWFYIPIISKEKIWKGGKMRDW